MKREPWHESLLESLAVLGDIQLQKRIWIDGDDAIFLESPTELICQVFDDCAFHDLRKAGHVFSDEADTVLEEISSLAKKIDLEQQPMGLLNDPDWLHVTGLAQKALAIVERVLTTGC